MHAYAAIMPTLYIVINKRRLTFYRTTGLPKGVKVAHQNIIANVCQSLYMRELSQSYPAGQKPPERFLGFLPL